MRVRDRWTGRSGWTRIAWVAGASRALRDPCYAQRGRSSSMTHFSVGAEEVPAFHRLAQLIAVLRSVLSDRGAGSPAPIQDRWPAATSTRARHNREVHERQPSRRRRSTSRVTRARWRWSVSAFRSQAHNLGADRLICALMLSFMVTPPDCPARPARGRTRRGEARNG